MAAELVQQFKKKRQGCSFTVKHTLSMNLALGSILSTTNPLKKKGKKEGKKKKKK
jgi:hypothetical protein